MKLLWFNIFTFILFASSLSFAAQEDSSEYKAILEKYLEYGQISQEEVKESSLFFARDQLPNKKFQSKARKIASQFQPKQNILKITNPPIELKLQED